MTTNFFPLVLLTASTVGGLALGAVKQHRRITLLAGLVEAGLATLIAHYAPITNPNGGDYTPNSSTNSRSCQPSSSTTSATALAGSPVATTAASHEP